jgi:DNA repair exonuclease SbcCD ATPase subunit
MLLTIAKLRTRAWKPYRDEQELVLRPTVYAIAARHEHDRDRSNWLGKSSLPEAIDYALWGRLTKSVRRKVDWITEGEKSGEVETTLSDGSRIVRQLGRHGSEKLWLFPPNAGADGVLHQEKAQEAIERLVGMTKEDFLTVAYFQQRQMARLILCDPGPRMDLVAGWIRLGPLQECEEQSSAALSELTRRRDEETTRAAMARRTIADALARENMPDVETLRTAVTFSMGFVGKERESITRMRAECAATTRRRAHEPHARRFEAVVEEGKRLAVERISPPNPAEVAAAKSQLQGTSSAKGVADRDLGARVRLATGRFDGACPLVGEPCPSREFVTGGKARNEALRLAAEDGAQQATEKFEISRNWNTELQNRVVRAAQDERRLQELRDEARRLKPAWELWRATKDDPEAADRLAIAEKALRDAEQLHFQRQAALQTIEQQEGWIRDAEEKIAQLDAGAKTASAAAIVFGKMGAQRVIAEGVLGDIEGRAAETFGRCGIELGVKMVWSREGDGLAAACGACGQGLPASQKVRECPRCGAARGPKLVNKLDFEVSDRSGGAEDLAGGVLQLAASAWLREDRGSQWATAMIDEPFGQMDAANRRAFAGHLPTILRESGFAQAFVIAHHSGILDSLPGRIEIVSDGNHSTARVAH